MCEYWYDEPDCQEFLGCINVSPFKFSKKLGNVPSQTELGKIAYWKQIEQLEKDKEPKSDYEKLADSLKVNDIGRNKNNGSS